MGFNLSYVAARRDAKLFFNDLGFAIEEECEEPPFCEPSAYWIDSTGYTVVMLKDPGFSDAQADALATLSKDYEVIGVSVSEFNMHSSAICWRDGAEAWRVHHEGDGEVSMHLETSGKLPEILNGIAADAVNAQKADDTRERAPASQEGIPPELIAAAEKFGAKVEQLTENSPVDHIFDVPINLVHRLIGFRYDQYYEGNGFRFWTLVSESTNPAGSRNSARKAKPTFFQRLLGRKS